MKIAIFYLFLVGLALAQDELPPPPPEEVSEAPQPVDPVEEETTIESAVTESTPSNELITSAEETTVENNLLDIHDLENVTLVSTECADLNRRRSSLLECCEYPHVKYYDIFAKYCVDECVGVKDVCCSQICVWRKTKIINGDGQINIEGFKETLMETVMNKGEWEDLVNKNVASCVEECKFVLHSFCSCSNNTLFPVH